MICPNCKNNVPDGTKFCPNCGNNMSEGNQANTNQFQQSVNAENQQTNNGQNMNGQQMNYGQQVNNQQANYGQQMNNQQANYGQQMNNGQPQFNGNIQMPVKVPLGAKTWFVILMLIVFWPVGLYCMWKHKKFPMAVRIIVSVVAGIWFLSYVSAMFSDSSSSTYTPPESSYEDVTVAEITTEAVTAAETTIATTAEPATAAPAPVTEAPAAPAAAPAPANEPKIADLDYEVYSNIIDDSIYSIDISFTNNTGKEIKYLTFSCDLINAVGDVIYSEDDYTGGPTLLEVTGPISIGQNGTCTFDDVWINSTIDHARITEAEIEYMDGTIEYVEF